MNARTCLFAALLNVLAAGESLGFAIAAWTGNAPLSTLLIFAAMAAGNALFAGMFARRVLRWLPA